MKREFKFNHVGFPSKEKRGSIYMPEIKLWRNDADEESFHLEWLYFEEGSPMPEILKNTPHIAYEVDDLDSILAEEEILIPPFEAMEGLTCAFIMHDGIPFELMYHHK